MKNKACSPECCSQLGSALHNPWVLTWSQSAAQTRDIHMAFGGNMSDKYQHRPLLLHSRGPRHGPHQQNVTIASGDLTGSSHQAVPLHTHISTTSLHSAQLFHYSFSPVSPTHVCTPECLMLWVTHRAGLASGCLQMFVQPTDCKGNKPVAKITHSAEKLKCNIESSSLLAEPPPQPTRERSSWASGGKKHSRVCQSAVVSTLPVLLWESQRLTVVGFLKGRKQ